MQSLEQSGQSLRLEVARLCSSYSWRGEKAAYGAGSVDQGLGNSSQSPTTLSAKLKGREAIRYQMDSQENEAPFFPSNQVDNVEDYELFPGPWFETAELVMFMQCAKCLCPKLEGVRRWGLCSEVVRWCAKYLVC